MKTWRVRTCSCVFSHAHRAGPTHVRDRTFREDDSKIHIGRLPRVMAALRNLAIGVHRQDGHANIAAALRHAARDWHRPLTTLGVTG